MKCRLIKAKHPMVYHEIEYMWGVLSDAELTYPTLRLRMLKRVGERSPLMNCLKLSH